VIFYFQLNKALTSDTGFTRL